MKKAVIVINGAGGVGKDSLCDAAATAFKTRNISTITPIKEIATLCGWNGVKDNKSRKFLSDMKRLCSDYNDFPTNWAKAQFEDFLQTDEEILFVHIREAEEILKFVEATGGFAKTLLIRGGERFKQKCGGYGNTSDDDVENYTYDYYFNNDTFISDAKQRFIQFVSKIIET
jgi:hypothetical protein